MLLIDKCIALHGAALAAAIYMPSLYLWTNIHVIRLSWNYLFHFRCFISVQCGQRVSCIGKPSALPFGVPVISLHYYSQHPSVFLTAIFLRRWRPVSVFLEL